MISYIHKVHPRSRSLKIKIEPTGQVIVITPHLTPNWIVTQFVEKQLPWIKRTQAKLTAQRSQLIDEHHVILFGQRYSKEVTQEVTLKPGVTLQGEVLYIKPASSLKATQAIVQRTLDRFLKATAEKYIVPRTHQLAKIMAISFGHITLRKQKSRWGSCSSQGNLNFNWRLVHYPPEIIDYVIIHELAHRKEMNHSPNFWKIVRHYDPAYLQHRGRLKRERLSVH